ncbi:MAG: hypothetical protein LQ341_005169 [Variospora aurantia]|nr:MAG: hypothetical protein LQ341_005169 [Variospora aurantia]
MGQDIDSKLRLLTYALPQTARYFVDLASLEKNCPLDLGHTGHGMLTRPTISGPNNNTAPSTLESLPLELLHDIMYRLNLQTLIDIRSVNKRIRDLVTYTPAYRAITQHAPNALRFMLSLATASKFSLLQLYNALLSIDCFICGGFGDYLSALNCQRCCIDCIANSSELFAINIDEVPASHVPGREVVLTNQPMAVTFPGLYGDGDHLPQGRNRLVLVVPLWQAGIALYGWRPPQTLADFKGTTMRFRTVVRFPTLRLSTGILEWGLSCQGCYENHETSLKKPTLYTRDGFLRHYANCQPAQEKWQRYLTSGGEMVDFYWLGTKERLHTNIRENGRYMQRVRSD